VSLMKGNTNWVMFLAANGDPEDRHVFDLAFGIFCLESAGVNPNDIHIYIDGQDRVMISKLIAVATKHTYHIKTTQDFIDNRKDNSYENLIMFITGHGSIDGIDAAKPITPCALLNSIKNTPTLQHAVVYLGQCYAGIFNYIGAGRGRRKESEHDPDVIFIGATNLHESLSVSTTESLPGGNFPWIANLFLLYVFKWLSKPIDVDGDGKVTIIDSYKYAGVMSNTMNKTFKIRSFVRSLDLHAKWDAAKNTHDLHNTPQTLLAFQSIEAMYITNLTSNHIHQECWILNSIPAQFLEI
jgi:hypothetical protein